MSKEAGTLRVDGNVLLLSAYCVFKYEVWYKILKGNIIVYSLFWLFEQL